MTDAQEFRTIRKQMGLSQRSIAKLIGVTPSCVSRWEKGNVNIPIPIKRLTLRLLNDVLSKGLDSFQSNSKECDAT